MIAGPDMVLLRTPASVHGENLHSVSDFTVREGQTVPFVLTYRASHLSPPRIIDPEKALKHTEAFWKQWAGRCTYRGPWEAQVERSLITLKALTYAPTGGLLAAATTSLPEQPGGQRNWDYRFCWLRDATFALFSLMQTGYYDEAAAWLNWLLRAVAGSPDQVQIVYGLAGERELPEMELPWLPGYANSRPVRIGNAASEQLQLDIYGEISAVLHQARKGNLPSNEQEVALQWKLLEHLEKIWREPDEGIWEVRGPQRHFTHSKVMAWLAFDRAIESCEQFGLDGPVDRWRAIRQQIHDDVCQKAYDPELGSFVQSYGSKQLDASLLFLAKSRFLPLDDPRILGTVQAIDRNLIRDGFVLRYNTHTVDDGLPPGEGAFLPCSFWLADVYLLLGRTNEAQALFDKLLQLPNDVGLLSEEYDVAGKRLLGNFPQAFSHVALVNTALRLTQAATADPKPEMPKAA
ncbi:MAG TPA: glycoside hydrolase family 15 protein, partial [Candidatus Angelobacter sp.]